MINIERMVVSYRKACEIIKDRYLRKKEFYDDNGIDHVSEYDLMIHLDLPKDYIIIPEKRGHLQTTLKYPMSELIWYNSESRKVDIISEFGSIWKTMVDENGLVNSNYGYQTTRVLKKMFGEENYLEKAANHLIQYGELIINILDKETIYAKHDMPCNNIFKYAYDKNTNEIKCLIIARSLDLVFGYPYDAFYAQVLGHKLMNYMENIKDEDYYLKQVDYIPINGHIYTRDLTEEKLSKWDDLYIENSYIALDPNILKDKRVSKEVCQSYKTGDEVRQVRKGLISDYGRGTIEVKQDNSNVDLSCIDNIYSRESNSMEFEDLLMAIKLSSLSEESLNELDLDLSKNYTHTDIDRLNNFIMDKDSIDRKVAIYQYEDSVEYLDKFETTHRLIYINRNMHKIDYVDSYIVNEVIWKTLCDK